MKKLALINLIVLIAIKTVSACTAVAGSNIIEKNTSKVFTLLVISLIFFVGTVVLYQFMKNRGGLFPIFVGGITLFFSWSLSSTNGGDCGFGAIQSSQIGFAVTFVCFIAQFTMWFLFRKQRHAELS